MYVATDVPFRTQAEVDAAAKALAEQIAGAFAEFEGVARGNPKLRAGAAIAIDNLGAPFDGKYTVTTSRHSYDPTTGYTTHFAVTGRQERRLFGLASGGGARRAIGRASSIAPGQRRERPAAPGPGEADLPVAVRRLRQRLGAHRAAGRRQGPRALGAARGRRRGAGGLRAGRHPAALRGGRAVQRRRHAHARPVDLVDGGSGAINRRSLVSRRGHRIDLLDQDGRKEGIALATGDGKLSSPSTPRAARSPCTATAA